MGMLVISATVAIHASFMAAAGRLSGRITRPPSGPAAKALTIIAVVTWFFISICVQCWLWALVLIALGAFDGLEPALYFATVTFSTLGYGDLVLGPDFRLLGAFAATNGTMIFGWTTAMIFVAVQKVYGGGAAAGGPS